MSNNNDNDYANAIAMRKCKSVFSTLDLSLTLKLHATIFVRRKFYIFRSSRGRACNNGLFKM